MWYKAYNLTDKKERHRALFFCRQALSPLSKRKKENLDTGVRRRKLRLLQPADVRRGKETMYVNVRKAVAEGSVRNQPGTYG